MTDQTPAELVAQLSDAEKVALTAGADAWTTTAVDRLGIPAIRLGDGPHGVRRPHDGAGMSMFDSHPATCFPTAALLGSTWDDALVREVGVALGREAAAHGIAVLLGPGVNLKRTPVGGRDFEYFSEDPLVSSRLGAAWVEGLQSTGVGASLKHFAANNTERRRYGVDAVVDERALRELYLASFEPVITGPNPPATVMAAYNRLNGEHCTENTWLLGRVLRGEWGYDGLVLSDWGAAWDRAVTVPAGNDLAMPGLGARDDDYVLEALRAGELPREALDDSVARILSVVGAHSHAPAAAPVPDLDAHHRLARTVAAAGTVLLKNEGSLLPLAPGTTVALIGAFAAEPRFQGAGSSHVVPTRVDTLLGALAEALGAESGAVSYAPGYDREHATSSADQLAEARELAERADVAVVVVGLPETFETEGVDREHLRLPESHDRLVDAVRAVNPRTVVVLQNGSPVELPWRDGVPAIVEGYLGGQASGGALADVLLGAAEPGGRLAETFPVRYADHPVSRLPNGPVTVEYRESLYLGYRWFDSAEVPVAFPFGHGLSYTRFDWSDAVVRVADDDSEPWLAELSLRVTNIGDRAGCEVVQLYVHDVESTVFRPEQELRGFAKVTLEPGASERIVIRLDARAFRFWSPVRHEWVLEPGRFELRAARSSRDVGWRTTIELGRAEQDGAAPSGAGILAYTAPSRERGFPAADFERLLGHPAPPNVTAVPGEFTLDTAIGDMQQTRAGRILYRYVRGQAVKTIGAPAGEAIDAVAGDVVSQLALRMFPTVSEGALSRRRTVQLLALINGLARLRPGRRRGGPPRPAPGVETEPDQA